MDPDAALRRIRQIVREVQQGNDTDDASVHLDALIDQCDGLDEWLSRGGFLPMAWDTDRMPPQVPSTTALITTAMPTPGAVSPAQLSAQPAPALHTHAVSDALDI